MHPTGANPTTKPESPLPRLAYTIVQHRAFQPFIIGIILLAAVVVGLETSRGLMEQYGKLLHGLDQVIIWLFAVEAGLKMLQHGRKFYRYFQDPWNVFDFTIVLVCFLPLHTQFAAVLRLARILRTLRLITAVPRLQLLVSCLLKTIGPMSYVGVLLFLLFYVYAVLGVFLFRDNDPFHFGSLGSALLSLVRVVTLEDWTDIMYIQMLGSEAYPINGHDGEVPNPRAQPVIAMLYFVSFVLIGTMIMLNLFVGVIINSMQEAQQEKERAEIAKLRETADTSAHDEAALLEAKLDEIKHELHLLVARLEDRNG